jgi:RF-1 domain
LPKHPAALDPDRLLADCDVKHTRGSGPGGQHRNKVQTAVVITHRPTGVQAAASERRSQAQNRKAALFRLRVKLALEVRGPAPAPAPAPGSAPGRDAPSDLWRSRCRGGRIAINPEHDDFPAMLAEALDAIAAHAFDVKAAAEYLGCTVSQLVKLLHLEREALTKVNAQRRARGLARLQ